MSAKKAPVAVVLAAALALPAHVLAAPAPTAPGAVAAAPVAGSAGDPTAMSDEEKVEVAKGLYNEADTAFGAGNYADALAKFEEAYNVYAPSFHLFNFNIGSASYELGDCVKAKTAFQRFLDLVPEHPSRGAAQEKLIEIDRSGCANTVAPTVAVAPTVTPSTGPVLEDDEESPLLRSREDERNEAAQRERDDRDSKKKDPMLIAGAVLTAAGGAALIGSAISVALANSKANRLADLASPGDTGFPDGNYGDDEVFNLDQTNLPANNVVTIGLLVGGIVVAGVGIGLLVVGVKRSKKGGKKKRKKGDDDKDARLNRGPHLTGIGPAVLRGGGGASARVRF